MPERKNLDAQLDALLDAAEAEGRNPLEIHSLIHERKRRRAHAKAKAEQPELHMRSQARAASDTPHRDICACPGCVHGKLAAFMKQPINADDLDASAGAMDYLLLTMQDTLASGDVEDAIFAMARIARKAWAWNMPHLGPIEGKA